VSRYVLVVSNQNSMPVRDNWVDFSGGWEVAMTPMRVENEANGRGGRGEKSKGTVNRCWGCMSKDIIDHSQ